MKVPLPNYLITPPKSTVTCVKENENSTRRSLMVYSFSSDKKIDYLSHSYLLDKNNTGTEFILNEQGIKIAQLPIRQGRVHGNGRFFDPITFEEKTWHFYHGEPLSPGVNYQAEDDDDSEEMLELSATLDNLSEEKLLKTPPAEYIFNRKEKTMNFIFRPVAQNTIIRPLAEAVCMMHGGDDTSYVDPTDKKEKCITHNQLYSIIGLETVTRKGKVPVHGDLIAFQARHCPEKTHMKVEINDVFVCVEPHTTVDEALAQFRRKLRQKNKIDARCLSRQKD